jgi:hypothetical protein
VITHELLRPFKSVSCVFSTVAIQETMPPLALAPPAEQKRQRQAEKAAGAVAPREAVAQRSASFHGRGASEQQRHHLLRHRPRTQPDLLAGVREQGLYRRGGADAAVPLAGGRKKAAPSKVLVTVAVQRSMWPLHVMARTEWRVADLVAAAVELYVKEGRRPLLPAADPSAFSLHYSQFSLQST